MVNQKPLEQEFDFELLLARYLDNDLGEEELAQFETFLQENKEYRQHFIDTCRIAGSISDCVALRDRDFQPEPVEPTPTGSPILGFLTEYMPPLGSGFGATLTLVVAFVAVGLISFGLWGGFFGVSPSTPSAIAERPITQVEIPASIGTGATFVGTASSSDSVPTARLVEMANCLWDSEPLRVGDNVEVGRRIQLKSGLAKIAFTDRAEVILEGPADFSVVSEKAAELRYGRISANVFDAGKGFTIDSPGMEVLDLGTQFGFSVQQEGQGEVHVFKGEVEVKLKEKGKRASHSRLLTTHRAASLDSQKGRIDTLRFDPSRFIRTFEPSDLEITREYVEAVKAASPVAYWRFEYLSDGCVLNEMSDHYRGSSPMRLVLSEDVQNKTLAVEQWSLTRPYMMVEEPIQELANSTYSAECWVKPDGYEWITPVMLYFPSEKEGEHAAVSGLLELLTAEGNQWEPHARVVRGLHRFPPSHTYSSDVNCYSDKEYEPSRWVHLVLVSDETEMRLYVNGRLASKEPIQGRIQEAPMLSIGRFKEYIYPERRASDKEMAGQIDEVAIYGRCLDENEIQEHYRLGIEMQAEYPFVGQPRDQ